MAFPGLILGGLFDLALFAVLVIAGFVIAGTVGALKRPDEPYTTAVLASVAMCAVVTILAVAIRVAKGDDVQPAAYAFNFVLASGCGAFGALLAERRRSE